MPFKVCEIYDFTNLFWNDFTRKSVVMFVTWYIWSFGFCSVAKNYDSQMFLRSTMYRKSMALYSYFGNMVYIHLESLWAAKKNLYQNFKIYNVKGSSLSSLSLPPTKLAFRLVIEHGPLLMVALGVVLGPLSSSSLLPWELSLSPSDACISTCKA